MNDIVINLKVPPGFIRDIERFVLKELSTRLNTALIGISKTLRQVIAFYAELKIKASPEYISLTSGQLKGELGVVNARAAVADMIKAISEAAQIIVNPVTVRAGEVTGGLECFVLRERLEEVLGTPLASFTSEGGFEIPWAEWLLTRGPQIIVFDFVFKAGRSSRSRTGLGLMATGGGWRVPPEFSGTYEDNWLTRALDGVEEEIGKYIIDQLKYRFS
jgi:hypothetical protein